MATAVACVPEPVIALQPVSSGPSGTTVDIEGVGFGKGHIEIRWNSFDGPRLADAEGPIFTAKIIVPAVPDGLYAVLALGRDADGGITSAARAAFQVTLAGAGRSGVSHGTPKASSEDADSGRIVSGPALTTGLVGAGIGATAAALLSRRRRSD